MKYVIPVFLMMLLSAACGSGSGNGAETTASTVAAPPEDTGLDTYRMAMFTPDWRLLPLQGVDRGTALRIPSIGLAYDEEGRVTEAAGLWKGRRSDNVLVAETAPLLMFSHGDGEEWITFHHADGSPLPMQGVYGYGISRSAESAEATMRFLGEDMETIPMDGEVWSILFRPEGDGWHSRVLCDSAGLELHGPGSMSNRYLLSEDGRVTAIEVVGEGGERVPLSEGVYRLEMSYDNDGNILERRRLDENGIPVEDQDYPGWQTYEISDEGMTVGFRILDPDGGPAEDGYGKHRGEFIYDDYGRIVETRTYDAGGNPVTVGGVWSTRREYDDAAMRTTVTKLGTDGEPVEISGVATTVMLNDPVGNVTDISYWDAAGEPATDPIGVHRYTYSYDEHSRRIELRIWEPSGEPGTSSQGHHSEEFVYGDNGDIQYTRRYDMQGQPLQ